MTDSQPPSKELIRNLRAHAEDAHDNGLTGSARTCARAADEIERLQILVTERLETFIQTAGKDRRVLADYIATHEPQPAASNQWGIDEAFKTLQLLTNGSPSATGAMSFLRSQIERLQQYVGLLERQNQKQSQTISESQRSTPLHGGGGASNEPLVDRDAALKEFTAYFVRNYPGQNTIISDPTWHAPKIFRAAEHAIKSATSSSGTALAQVNETAEAGHFTQPPGPVPIGLPGLFTEIRHLLGRTIECFDEDEEERKDLVEMLSRLSAQPFCPKCGPAVMSAEWRCCKCGADMRDGLPPVAYSTSTKISEQP